MSFRQTWKVGFCVPLLSLGALHPLAARAAPPPREPAAKRATEFQTYLQAAIRMYESLDYEQALEKLTRAKTYVRNLEDDALLSFYEGIILADMNRREQARTAFRSGLLLKPDATLPMKVSPKVEKDFEAVRAEVQHELALVRAKQEPQRQAEAVKNQPPPQEKPPASSLTASGPVPSQPSEARRPALTPALSSLATTPLLRSKGLSYALVGGGVAVAGVGVFLGVSGLSYNERKKDMTINETVKARVTAQTQLSVGTVLLGTGLAALGTGTVLLLLPQPETGTGTSGSMDSLVLSPLPDGFALGSTGRF